MARPGICPEEILSQLTRLRQRRGEKYLALYDKVRGARSSPDSYRVISDMEYCILQRCHGYDPLRYEVVASTSGP